VSATGRDVRRAPGPPAGRLDDDRCSVQALARDDSPVATAPPAQRWLLVEQPGAWGHDPLAASRFDPAVAGPLAQRAHAEGVRVLLIRRPGNRAAEGGRRWATVDARPGHERVSWAERRDDAEILDSPWDGSAGTPSQGPLYLVCAHGAHDVCCAVRGRSLARDLAARSDGVWECSHLGGCRFAANLLVLPQGFYYGQVPGDGADVVAAHARGEVALPWLRGRAGLSLPTQAAQHLARRELGLLRADALPPVRATGPEHLDEHVERWQVVLAGPEGELVVDVESRPSGQAGLLTCRARNAVHPRTWHLLSLSG
jgi:hypothetical protein